MRRIGYNSLAAMVLAVGLLTSALAFAQAGGDGRTCPGNTPTPNAAVVTTRVFNDCPTSILTVNNLYPASITIDDQGNDCFGGANRHVWHLSDDGGQTAAKFENCSHYRFGAHVVLNGVGPCESGLLLSPWWSIADGQFMINGGSGEIAIFGGRLPFYSFTANYGLTYVKGTNIYLEYTYNPRGLSSTLPATILYHVFYNGQNYYSPYLPFDQGTAAEDPPHGLWGELYPASPGGYVQDNNGQGTPNSATATWDGFQFEGPSATPTTSSTWGRVKTLYR